MPAEATPEPSTVACRLCRADTVPFAVEVILGHRAEYVQCVMCGTVQIPSPTWLEIAYSDAIAASDVGLVTRCATASKTLAMILHLEGRKEATGIDWAGGTGLLTRMMRDLGYDTRHFDPIAENVHAKGSAVEAPGDVTFVSAIECLEHLVNPVEDVSPFVSRAEYFFVTTEVLPVPTPRPFTWWYYAPDTGQHITLATLAGVHAFLRTLEFSHVSQIGSLFIASRSPLRRRTRLAIRSRAMRGFTRAALPAIRRRRSLIGADYEEQVSRMRLAGSDLGP